ncbi:MAG: DUF899 family protein [Phycisphaerales bacterium]
MSTPHERHNQSTASHTQHAFQTAEDILYEPLRRFRAERLAQLRAIPPQPITERFTFRTPEDRPITLSELFADHSDMLIIHNMGRRCSYCTLWADTLIGIARHIQRRCALVLCSADEPPALAAAIKERGWNFPCVSGAHSGFNEAMNFGTSTKALPGVSSLHRSPNAEIHRITAAAFGPGDDFCPVWPFFDLLKEGPNGWQPD